MKDDLNWNLRRLRCKYLPEKLLCPNFSTMKSGVNFPPNVSRASPLSICKKETKLIKYYFSRTEFNLEFQQHNHRKLVKLLNDRL